MPRSASYIMRTPEHAIHGLWADRRVWLLTRVPLARRRCTAADGRILIGSEFILLLRIADGLSCPDANATLA